MLWLSACQTTAVIPQPETVVEEPQKKTHFIETTEEFDPYPFVGSIRRQDESLIGSGVLIEDDIVLTAAHVVEDTNNPFFFRIQNEDILIEEIIIHSDYFMTDNDIAILILACPASEKPITIITDEDILFRNSPLITVGFGRGYKKFSLPDTFFYYGTLVGDEDQIKFLPLKDTIWFGDSGGAVLTYVGGKLKLVGIMSHFRINDEYKVFENSASSVQYFYTWIKEVIDERMERMAR